QTALFRPICSLTILRLRAIPFMPLIAVACASSSISVPRASILGCAAADVAGNAAVGPARADQSVVCGSQDRGHQIVRSLSAAAWRRFRLGDADQSLRPWRQLPPQDSHVPAALVRRF